MVSFDVVPREPSSTDTFAITRSSGASTTLTKSYSPSVAHWFSTLTPSCSTSLVTSWTRPGLSFSVRTPFEVSFVSMMNTGMSPPRSDLCQCRGARRATASRGLSLPSFALGARGKGVEVRRLEPVRLKAWMLPLIVLAIAVPIVVAFALVGPQAGLAVGAVAATVILVVAAKARFDEPIEVAAPATDHFTMLVVVTSPLEDPVQAG